MRPSTSTCTYSRSRSTPLRSSHLWLLALYASQTPLAQTFSNRYVTLTPLNEADLDQQLVSRVYADRVGAGWSCEEVSGRDGTSDSLPLVQFARDRQLNEAEEVLEEVLQKMRDEHCLRGDEPTLDDLLYPLIEREDLNPEYLRFSDGKEGISEIVRHVQGEAGDNDDPEPGLKFSSKDALDAAGLLEKILRERPDLEMAMSLGTQLRNFRSAITQEAEENKVQRSISSYFK
ncbi:hypothetical protein GGX14DRAFT_571892 [Mycena pura]|uniref:Uncharacterized protein n=1 Tax=Mycena pura TaxID=153505 RepID=A0AAD6Y4H0_9AGAR|nr:hypothetical protein GGX14DRAFT_571892 [Mycena pura]